MRSQFSLSLHPPPLPSHLQHQGTPVYESPEFTDYPYKKGSDPATYSPPRQIAATKLGVSVPAAGSHYIEFDFQNMDRNLQLLVRILTSSVVHHWVCGGAPRRDACDNLAY